MDALLGEMRNLIKKSEVQGCVVGVWVKSQDPEFQEVMAGLQKSANLNLTELLNLFKKHNPDLPFKRTSFVMHMRGQCLCHAV
jgi:hypothetical protein